MATDKRKGFNPVGNHNVVIPDLDDDMVAALVETQNETAAPADNAGWPHITDTNDDVEFSAEEIAEAEKRRSNASSTIAERAKAKVEGKPTPTAQQSQISMALPKYLLKQLKSTALADDSSIKYEILMALTERGYKIKQSDLVKDQRRAKPKKKQT